jgi:hypothetical protein
MTPLGVTLRIWSGRRDWTGSLGCSRGLAGRLRQYTYRQNLEPARTTSPVSSRNLVNRLIYWHGTHMEASRTHVVRWLTSGVGCLWVSFPTRECGLVLDNAHMCLSRAWIRRPPSSFPSEPLKHTLLPPSAKRATR